MNSNPVIALALALLTFFTSAVLPTAETEALDDLTAFYGAAVATQNALAADYTATVLSDGTLKITKYKGTGKEITVPSSIDGKAVTVIGEFSFSDCHTLKKVTLPSTVTTVEKGAFNLCDSLLSIEVSSESAYLSSIDGVLYNKDVTTLLAVPGGKSGAYTIPKTVTVVADYAADHCYKLTSLNMYNSVMKIGAHAFSFCWNITSLRLSDRLSSIGEQSFSYCNGIKEYHLPASLKEIGEDAVLGTVSSNGDKQYYFINGIFCVPETYSYNYVKSLGVVVSDDVRTVTDIDSGLVLIDENNSLPYGADLSVTPLNTDENIYGFKKYDTYALFDVSLTNNGKAYTPRASLTLSFDGALPTNAPAPAIKLYTCSGSSARLIYKAPNEDALFVSFNAPTRFALVSSTDFLLKGDCDGDGVITTYDALTAFYNALDVIEFTPEQTLSADIDSDGKVSTLDVISILRCAAGIEEL